MFRSDGKDCGHSQPVGTEVVVPVRKPLPYYMPRQQVRDLVTRRTSLLAVYE